MEHAGKVASDAFGHEGQPVAGTKKVCPRWHPPEAEDAIACKAVNGGYFLFRWEWDVPATYEEYINSGYVAYRRWLNRQNKKRAIEAGVPFYCLWTRATEAEYGEARDYGKIGFLDGREGRRPTIDGTAEDRPKVGKAEFAELFEMLWSAFHSSPVNTARESAYYAALKGFSRDVLERKFQAAIRNSPKFPTIAEILHDAK